MTPGIFVKLSLKSSKKAKLGSLKYHTERKYKAIGWLPAHILERQKFSRTDIQYDKKTIEQAKII